jgi:hypothetical protein
MIYTQNSIKYKITGRKSEFILRNKESRLAFLIDFCIVLCKCHERQEWRRRLEDFSRF